jgi:dephospho-CoA kinase
MDIFKKRKHVVSYCGPSSDTGITIKDSEAFPSLKILGICGSIGSGKSYASSLLTSNLDNMAGITAHHIDTDSLAHGVYAPGSKAIDEIGDEFGKNVIVDCTIDRKALGSIVFSDRSKMEKLERIVWPHVKSLLIRKIQEIERSTEESEGNAIVIVEAAVLLDADWDANELFDGIWIIRASEETSIERLVKKRGMEREEAIKRLEAQLSRRGIGNWEQELQERSVTAVILNEGSDLWDKLKNSLVDPECWKDNRCPSKHKGLA